MLQRTVLAVLLLSLRSASGASLPTCESGARVGAPCQLSFTTASDLSIEFRSPAHTTLRMESFATSPRERQVRFTPTDAGAWAYRVTSLDSTLDAQEKSFSVAESDLPGIVSVANLRHWRTRKRQPHLWLSAEAPWHSMSTGAFTQWLDSRKTDGFTHVRGVLLMGKAGTGTPVNAEGDPDPAYFESLDDKLLAAAQRGFVLDLVLADAASEQLLGEKVIRQIVARYGGLNVTWQGVASFDDRAGTRVLLRRVAEWLKQYDGYNHPRSSDAAVSSSPLLNDGWMDFLIESSPHPELGAVEHQFNHIPQIHVIRAEEPAAFRRELWNATASGEYPSVSYQALTHPENARAVQVWKRVLSGTRHWEFEPFFDVSGAVAVGLAETEYLAYAPAGGIVEIQLPKHKYNPSWINPITGEEAALKNYKGETFSQPTPDNAHDWVLALPREGHRENLNKYYYFESTDPPMQEVEFEGARAPFQLVQPAGEEFNHNIPVPYETKVVRANRGSRRIQYLWWGEVVAGGEGQRLLGTGPSGTLRLPDFMVKESGSSLNLRVQAINANGKAYQLDRVYRVTP